MNTIDRTHDPDLRSWVESANEPGTPFPVQNLPFGRFRCSATEPWQIGVAIGDEILGLRRAGVVSHDDMDRILTLPVSELRRLRQTISEGLCENSRQLRQWRECLVSSARAELGLPCEIRNYSDFYIGIHHATAAGRLFRPDNPLLPNYKWVPIGYHGRTSTVTASANPFHRPWGQIKGPHENTPVYSPSKRLDYELELGLIVGQPNKAGSPIPIHQAAEHLFGITLLNDWSARDIQSWEYQPLGPFLGKSFATSLSPWIVTTLALAPFRVAVQRPADDPEPLPYLHDRHDMRDGAFDIDLQASLLTAAMRAQSLPAVRICESNFAEAAYWSPAQLIAHQTANGCELQPGDLLGSGTLSGKLAHQAASLLEQTLGGTKPITLPNGEQRTFLEDGDCVILEGWCHRPGFRSIGMGQCQATVLPAVDLA